MKFKSFFIVILLCCAAGALFFLIQRNWIIVHFAFAPQSFKELTHKESAAAQKTVKLFWSKNNTWHQSTVSLVWDEHNQALNAQQLIKQWLIALQDEHLISGQIKLESVAVSAHDGTAYLSFNRSLFSPEWSIIKKWLILEGLFKTIHYAQLPIQSILFLINKKPMEDEHLDFTQPIPVHERL